MFTSRFEATRGLFWTEPRNFEPRSDDEGEHLSWHSLSKLPYHTSGRTFGPDGFSVIQARLRGGSSVEWGFEPGALRARGWVLTTRPPGPKPSVNSLNINKIGHDPAVMINRGTLRKALTPEKYDNL
ncbi:hypothetical protein AVEN_41744-1 [Araneus ventricosus]|uniref:Uncharacterized protein n=1 Tax=Araneus ventricosus TaxID=182803 RepID=A0A4Y2ABN7_ARAVE|nr:hypothetical protein AVEN_41744-1 [Araneus ventricosus]